MDLFQILLFIHVFGGGLSLVLGLYILIAQKGTRMHSMIGKFYYFSMLSCAMVAIPMSFIHPNYFLFLISIFTIYMLLSGVRYLKIHNQVDVKLTDKFLSVVMFLFAVAFIGFGIYHLIGKQYFGIVFVVFGAIGLLFCYQDNVNYNGKSNIKNFFLTTHLQRMVGSYIASITAFLVVNNKILPGVVAWLLPTIILVPLIVFWIRKYKVVEH